MASTDARVAEEKPVTPAFILAALLWPPVVDYKKSLEDNGMEPMEALTEAANSLTQEQLHHIAIPRRFTAPMREIWEFQLRLQKRKGRGLVKHLAHRRFRAAYDFLLLREQSGEDLEGLGQFWTEMQEKHPDVEVDTSSPDESNPRPRRRRRRRKRQQ
jgi:poly(A) polymerase